MKFIIGLYISFFSLVPLALAQGPVTAWWYDITFNPNQKTLRGVPLSILDKQWVTARALSIHDLVGKIPPSELDRFNASKFHFSTRVDLNQDGVREQLLVGVFQRIDGGQGRFLVVFRKGAPPKVFMREGSPGFSALLQHEGRLRWYFCMECDDYETLVLSGASDMFLE